jgi:DNA repair exonuclease SbcCD ATPase subunit
MLRAKLWALPIALAATGCLIAESATPRAAAKTILEQGWEKTAAAQQLVNNEFNAHKDQAANDPVLLAAHWMALTNQSRYKDSLESLNAFLKGNPDSVQALQTKVFALTALQNYKDAVLAADELAKVVTQKPAAEQAEALEFLGRFAGFLGGPLGDVSNAEQRKTFEEQILKPFGEPHKKLFEKQKEGVLEKLKQFEMEAAKKADGQKDKAAADDQRVRERLEKEKAKLLEDGKNLEEGAKKEEEKERMEIDILNQRLTGADRQIIELERRKKPYVDNLAKAQPEAQRAQREAEQQKDPQVRQRLQTKVQAMIADAQGYQIQIDNLNEDIAKWGRGKKEVEQQIQKVRGSGVVRQQNLEKQRKQIERDIQNNEVKLKRLERDANNPAKAVALPAHARLLSSYATLPLNDWRTRLLKNLQ